MHLTAGLASSEYRKALRAEVVGIAVAVIGIAGVCYGVFAQSSYGTVAGIALVFAGLGLIGHSARSYITSRGAAKAAREGANIRHTARGI